MIVEFFEPSWDGPEVTNRVYDLLAGDLEDGVAYVDEEGYCFFCVGCDDGGGDLYGLDSEGTCILPFDSPLRFAKLGPVERVDIHQ